MVSVIKILFISLACGTQKVLGRSTELHKSLVSHTELNKMLELDKSKMLVLGRSEFRLVSGRSIL